MQAYVLCRLPVIEACFCKECRPQQKDWRGERGGEEVWGAGETPKGPGAQTHGEGMHLF